MEKRYEIECNASNRIVRYASTLRGVRWHLGRLNGLVSVLDRKTWREIALGTPDHCLRALRGE